MDEYIADFQEEFLMLFWEEKRRLGKLSDFIFFSLLLTSVYIACNRAVKIRSLLSSHFRNSY